jgi:hypothetical protein
MKPSDVSPDDVIEFRFKLTPFSMRVRAGDMTTEDWCQVSWYKVVERDLPVMSDIDVARACHEALSGQARGFQERLEYFARAWRWKYLGEGKPVLADGIPCQADELLTWVLTNDKNKVD